MRGVFLWAAGAGILWAVESALRLSWGDPPAGPDRIGLGGLFLYLAAGTAAGLAVTLGITAARILGGRERRGSADGPLHAAFFLFLVLCLYRLPWRTASPSGDPSLPLFLPSWTGTLLLSLGWAALVALVAAFSWRLVLRPLGGGGAGGSVRAGGGDGGASGSRGASAGAAGDCGAGGDRGAGDDAGGCRGQGDDRGGGRRSARREVPAAGGRDHRLLAALAFLLSLGAAWIASACPEGMGLRLLLHALGVGLGTGLVLWLSGAGIARLLRPAREGSAAGPAGSAIRAGSLLPPVAALLLLLLGVLGWSWATPRPDDPQEALSGERRGAVSKEAGITQPGTGAQRRPGPSAAAADRVPGPNLLLITVDTLRADHLSAYRYPRSTSPHIDRLARQGTLFEEALCPQPRTVPSLASLMTGLYPQEHGVRDNTGAGLSPRVATLAERLRAAGYRTAALTGNGLVHPSTRLDRGFDYFFAPAGEAERAPYLRTLYERAAGAQATLAQRTAAQQFEMADSLTARALDVLEVLAGNPAGDRFFLWIHYFDPHMAYGPPAPFNLKFGAGYRGPYRYVFDYRLVSKGYMTFRCPLPPQDLQRARDLYDAEIAYTDDRIGQLLGGLERARLADSTAVILTADHGESLGEHEYSFDHGDFLYEDSLRVPLIVRLPGRAGGRRAAAQVSLLDLAPTLLELAGGEALPTPVSGYGGRSLLPLLAAPREAEAQGSSLPAPGRPCFAESGHCYFPWLNDRLQIKPPGSPAAGGGESGFFDPLPAIGGFLEGRLRMVRRDGWKLILTPGLAGADRLELYDLRQDPGETRDLAAGEPQRVQEMLAELRAWMAADRGTGAAAAERATDRSARDRLQALGYIEE